MTIEPFARGLAVGFAVAAPVGPIGMLVIRRTLVEGRLMGLVTGLGAAVADAFYGAVGAFGLTFISGLLLGHGLWTRALGGLFLCYLGVDTLRTLPKEEPVTAPKARYAGAFFTTVLLTLANPITILSFMAIFAGLGLGNGGSRAATATLFGVLLGSASWWLILSGGVSLLKHRLPPGTMRWINRGSGLCLLAFGVTTIAELAR